MKKHICRFNFKLIIVSLILIIVSSLTIHIARASSIRIKLTLNMYNSDEALLLFMPNGLGRFSSSEDALKFFNPTVNLYSKSTDNQSLAINTFPTFTTNHITPLTVTGQTFGNYHLLFTELLDFDTLMSITLYDNFTATTTTIVDSTDVMFSITSNPASQGANRFQLSFQGNSPLPVSWLSFHGERIEKIARLSWSTASEKNSSYFSIQKSFDGTKFSDIGTVKAVNFSSQVTNYSFDEVRSENLASYYRIMEVDINGSIDYSKIIYMQQRVASIISFYPNPVSSDVTIENPLTELLEIEVINSLGLKVHSQVLFSGTNSFSLEYLPAGIYIFRPKLNNSNFLSSGKFIKQ